MKLSQIFILKNLDKKLEEFLTRQPNENRVQRGKKISALKLRVFKDGKEFFITYTLGKPEPKGKGKSHFMVFEPNTSEDLNLCQLIELSDSIHNYHGGYKYVSIEYKNTKSKLGGISKVRLKNQLSSEDIIEAIEDFYPYKTSEFKVLKMRYR